MQIKSIKSVGPMQVYDLTVKDVEQYVLENGVVSHNTGVMYSADNVYIIGRRQIKDGTDLQGYQFVLNVEKSRTVKEKSKFFVDVTFDGGIDLYSGLLDMGVELGFVVKPKNGWYTQAFLNEETGEMVPETKNWRAKDTRCVDFWGPLLRHEPFKKSIENNYKLGSMVQDKTVEDEVESLLDLKSETREFAQVKIHDNIDNIEDELETM